MPRVRFAASVSSEDVEAASPAGALDTLIKFEHVSKFFGEGKNGFMSSTTCPLRHAMGEFISILGPSGRGKMGFGVMPKVWIAFLIAFFPIVIDTVVGLRSVQPELLQLGRSMGNGTLRVFLKLRLPNALPNVFAGLKVAITLAVVGAITGEFVGSQSGLGYLLTSASGQMDTALVFAVLLTIRSSQ